MYDYRKLSPEEQRDVVTKRRLASLPLHEPPHREISSGTYLITAANYEHNPLMEDENRRDAFQEELLDGLLSVEDTTLWGWCVLSNHYHVLATVDLPSARAMLGRLHNGTSTRWNREDGTPGRRVWFRSHDRGIKSERHRCVALNYIHANPVKHGYVSKSIQWPWSSFGFYRETQGQEQLQKFWRDYPVLDFGQGWDW